MPVLAYTGVNMDTEAANLIEQQQAYQASARVLATARELLIRLFRLCRGKMLCQSAAALQRPGHHAFQPNNLDIQQTQDKVATGKKVLKASDDPVAAATISFVRDQKVMLDRFATNIDRAQTRLTLTENVVAESVNLLTRAYELGIQAKNDTLTAVDRRAISFEISQIRESMMSLANSKDVNGNYLFAGYRTNIQPFVSNEAGEVTFAGDRGVHSVQISDSLRANTGLDGADVFMRVDIDGTTKPFFDVLTSMERELQGGTINNDTVAELNACIDHFAVNQTRVEHGSISSTTRSPQWSAASC